ncbi:MULTISPECIES: glycosyltransferase family 4 protein [Rahnella]|jgi:UDP-glucose:(heptosyl)LPS alpha-1,3-glucosyltransferase|uniref:glycosyltransferase family 4 protein n=1 Tax=Rahnella TaxID=34037 RepID=UPI00055CFC61|nr:MULTISPECIES: glycosyltransferase family 4 protein [Rahnella]NIA91206.1 glycosyltransferase family 4 protein [Rahnella aceris]
MTNAASGKNIRLAIVRQKYRPDGGAERFISRALEALDDQNIDLNIITRQWEGKPNPQWKIHLCNPAKYGRVSREKGFAAAAQQCWKQEHFDIVQSHERIPGCDIFRAGDGAHRVWLEQRARVISPLQRFLTKISPYHRYVLQAEEEMFHSPALKKIICNSEMVKRDIIRCYGVDESRFEVIYNAIDSQKFVPATDAQRLAAREMLSIPAQAVALIYVGSGFERKGLKPAIEAIACGDRYLIVVGQDKDQKKYESLAKQSGCADRVRFVGVQNNVLPYYHAADGMILPTLYDPFPNVILEAMACGLPVITSETCGGAEFILQGREGFVCDALDVIRLSEYVNKIPSRQENDQMGNAARERILPYSPKNLSKQLVTLYHSLLV